MALPAAKRGRKPQPALNPDFVKPPEGDYENMKEWRAAQRPVAPATAYTHKRIVGVSAMNFKSGKEETTTRNGKTITTRLLVNSMRGRRELGPRPSAEDCTKHMVPRSAFA